MGERPFSSSGKMYLGCNVNLDGVYDSRRVMDIDTELAEFYGIWPPFVYGIGSEPI